MSSMPYNGTAHADFPTCTLKNLVTSALKHSHDYSDITDNPFRKSIGPGFRVALVLMNRIHYIIAVIVRS